VKLHTAWALCIVTTPEDNIGQTKIYATLCALVVPSISLGKLLISLLDIFSRTMISKILLFYICFLELRIDFSMLLYAYCFVIHAL